jgi:hypothetical protein
MRVSEVFAAVLAFLEADGWPTALRTEIGEVVATKYQGESGRWMCEARVDTWGRVSFYSAYPESVPEDRRLEVSEFLTRANWALVVGNFELDLRDGELRVKTSIDTQGTVLPDEMLRALIYTNVGIMDRYIQSVAAVIEDGVSAAEAIARIES